MARYLVHLKDGRGIEVDDARVNGAFIEYITKDLHQAFAIPYTNVDYVESKPSGMSGGERFASALDTGFGFTPGSVGAAFQPSP